MDSHQRGKGRGGPTTIATVADRALAQVQVCANVSAGLVGRQTAGPRDVIRIDVQHAVPDIDSRATPLRAAIKAGHHNGLRVHAQRYELPIAAESAELLLGKGMRLGRARCEHVFR